MQWLAQICVRRPVFASVLMLLVVVVGAAGYVAHRLRVAGAARPIFSAAAVERLHAASGGVPRVLNHLATQALIEGMARGREGVGSEEVEAVLDTPSLLERAPQPQRAAKGAAR